MYYSMQVTNLHFNFPVKWSYPHVKTQPLCIILYDVCIVKSINQTRQSVWVCKYTAYPCCYLLTGREFLFAASCSGLGLALTCSLRCRSRPDCDNSKFRTLFWTQLSDCCELSLFMMITTNPNYTATTFKAERSISMRMLFFWRPLHWGYSCLTCSYAHKNVPGRARATNKICKKMFYAQALMSKPGIILWPHKAPSLPSQQLLVLKGLHERV